MFEYFVGYYDPFPMGKENPVSRVEYLNNMGEEGWELVSIENNLFYFKREKQPEAFQVDKK